MSFDHSKYSYTAMKTVVMTSRTMVMKAMMKKVEMVTIIKAAMVMVMAAVATVIMAMI